MADSAKDLMAQNLPGSGDKDKKDASSAGGTVPQASDESNEEHDDADDQDETDSNDVSTDDDLPEGSKTAVIPPEQDSFGSLDDEAKGKADGNKTVNLRDGPESGGSGDSGGNKPPAPPGGDDGKANEGGGGGDGKKPSRAQAEVIELLKTAVKHVGNFARGSDHIRESDKTVVDLTNALRLASAGPMTDDDYDMIKKLLMGLMGPLEGMSNTFTEVIGRGNNSKADELLKKLGFRQ